MTLRVCCAVRGCARTGWHIGGKLAVVDPDAGSVAASVSPSAPRRRFWAPASLPHHAHTGSCLSAWSCAGPRSVCTDQPGTFRSATCWPVGQRSSRPTW